MVVALELLDEVLDARLTPIQYSPWERDVAKGNATSFILAHAVVAGHVPATEVEPVVVEL